jgi:hypothetical protein
MRGNDAVAGSLVSCIDLEKRLRPQQPLRVIRGLVNRADHGQMESSERVRMLEKQICRTSCVNSCERNMPKLGWQFTLVMAACNLLRLPKLLVVAA